MSESESVCKRKRKRRREIAGWGRHLLLFDCLRILSNWSLQSHRQHIVAFKPSRWAETFLCDIFSYFRLLRRRQSALESSNSAHSPVRLQQPVHFLPILFMREVNNNVKPFTSSLRIIFSIALRLGRLAFCRMLGRNPKTLDG